ncbi:MAG: O-antigen ligase family protein [bacterium]
MDYLLLIILAGVLVFFSAAVNRYLNLLYYRQTFFIIFIAAAVMIILINPKYGIFLIGATIPLEDVGLVFAGGTFGFTLSKLVGLLTAYAWFMHRIVRQKKLFGGAGYLTPLAVLLLILTASVGFSRHPEVGVTSLISFTGFILMYMMIRESVEGRRDLSVVANVLAASTALAAAFGLLQHFTASPIIGMSDYWKLPGYADDPFTITGRIRGTYLNPNYYSMHMVMIFPLVFMFFLREKRSVVLKALYLAAAATILGAVFFAESRAAWLALLAALTVQSALVRRARVAGLAALMIFLGLFAFQESRYTERAMTVIRFREAPRVSSIGNRRESLKYWAMIIGDYPLMGVGINQAKMNVQRYGFILPTQTHNVFLLLLVENGVFAFLIFVLLLYSVARRLAAHFAGEKDEFYRSYSAAMLAAITAFVVFGLFHDNFWTSITWYTFGLASAAPVIAAGGKRDEEQGGGESPGGGRGEGVYAGRSRKNR